MSPVCNFLHKCFAIWKTGKCKCMMGLKFCANWSFAESEKIEKFFLGIFSTLKRFVWPVDEEFQLEAVQSNVISSKTINHHINRTLSIQASLTYDEKRYSEICIFLWKISFFEWQLDERNPDSCSFEGNLVRNLKRMKPISFMCLDMFIWLPLHGAKCNISEWCNSSGEENKISWDEQKAASSFGGKISTPKKLENYCSYWPQQSFFLPCARYFANHFIDRCSRMAKVVTGTALSETRRVVLKKDWSWLSREFIPFCWFRHFLPPKFALRGIKRNSWFPVFIALCH